MIRVIVCVDKNWGIGKKNNLLFQLPEDMEYFKKMTMGHTVCMGYNTLLSLPNSKPLKGRTNIIIAPDEVNSIEGAIVVHNLEQLFEELNKRKHHEDIYICGGAMFYKSMLPYCEEALVTKVMADGEAEVFFPNLNEEKDYQLIKNYGIRRSTNGKMYCFTTYINNHPHKLQLDEYSVGGLSGGGSKGE